MTEDRCCYIVENPETGYRRFFYYTDDNFNSARDAAFRYALKNQNAKIPAVVYLSKMERIWEYAPEPEEETDCQEPLQEALGKSDSQDCQKSLKGALGKSDKPEPRPADFPNF